MCGPILTQEGRSMRSRVIDQKRKGYRRTDRQTDGQTDGPPCALFFQGGPNYPLNLYLIGTL